MTPLQLNNESEEEEEEDEYQNQYRLIYPSERNTETYYQKFFDHSQKCYEQFTGSYSKKKAETAKAE